VYHYSRDLNVGCDKNACKAFKSILKTWEIHKRDWTTFLGPQRFITGNIKGIQDTEKKNMIGDLDVYCARACSFLSLLIKNVMVD